ncbi:hypothetical protein Taro_015306 [Colocasia esculenta]|uniref:Uncharacterized protein n=1 Tax=Colocasia esculenta TaxID=4460 RepID=A0A843ULZ6_COLES|nr:hypothetical protein [Colocasia esculenta]
MPFVQGSCLRRAVRGGGGGVLSYEKALTGGFPERLFRNPARLVTRSPRRPRSCRGGAPDRDMVATLLCVASRTVASGGRVIGVDATCQAVVTAFPVFEVVTIAWDPRPREPVEGVLRATSVLELAATRRTPELRGKRWLGQWRVSRLQSSRGWSGTPRTVRLPSSGRVRAGRRRRGSRRGPRS